MSRDVPVHARLIVEESDSDSEPRLTYGGGSLGSVSLNSQGILPPDGDEAVQPHYAASDSCAACDCASATCFPVGTLYLGFSILLHLTSLVLTVLVITSYWFEKHITLFKVGVGFAIAYLICSAALTIRFLAKHRNQISTPVWFARLLSSILLCRAPVEQYFILNTTRGDCYEIVQHESDLRADMILRALLWNIPQVYLQCYAMFITQTFPALPIASVCCGTLCCAMILGRALATNYTLNSVLAVAYLMSSIGAAVMHFVTCSSVWHRSTVYIYLVEGGSLWLVMLLVVVCCTATTKRVRACGTDVFFAIVLPIWLTIYAAFVPAGLFVHKSGGYSRWAAIAYYPTLILRALATAAALYFLPVQWLRWPLTVACVVVLGSEFVLSVPIVVLLVRTVTLEGARAQWMRVVRKLNVPDQI